MTYVLAIAAFFISHNAFAQSLDTAHATIYDPSEISNEIFLRTDEVVFGEELQFLTDDIERIAMRKISLLTATRNDLLAIPTLTDLDISGIFSSTKSGIPISKDILQRLQYFIKAATVNSQYHISLRTRVELDPNAYKETVYQNDTYHGSPVKTSTRLIATTDDFLFSLTQSKNAGEPEFFDFLSGSFGINHPLLITDDVSLSKCVFGDYSLSFGSGLLFSNGSSQAPVRDIHALVESHSSGIVPYISSTSFRFFRGAASEITSGIFSASGFFSDRKIDATVVSDTIISLYANGYHRSAAELARKNQAESSIAGGHISVTPIEDDNHLEFGATGYTLGYDKPVNDSSARFYGQKHSMLSTDMRGTFSTLISVNGEFARMISDVGKANAFAVSMMIQPAKLIELSMNYHELPANFISPFGGTFGINSGNAQNEKGFYIGSKFNIIPSRLIVSASGNFSTSVIVPLANQSSMREVKYSDIRLRSTYSLQFIPLRLSIELRSNCTGKIFSIGNDSLSKNSVRVDAVAAFSKTLNVSFRSEYQQYYSSATMTIKDGYLYSAKFAYMPLPDIYISTGLSFSNTDTYSSRFYSSENNLPGAAPYESLYGTAYRYNIVCSYDPSDEVELSVKIAESRSVKSSSIAIVDKTTIGAQIDIAF